MQGNKIFVHELGGEYAARVHNLRTFDAVRCCDVSPLIRSRARRREGAVPSRRPLARTPPTRPPASSRAPPAHCR